MTEAETLEAEGSEETRLDLEPRAASAIDSPSAYEHTLAMEPMAPQVSEEQALLSEPSEALLSAVTYNPGSRSVWMPGRERETTLGPVDPAVRAALGPTCDLIGQVGAGGMGDIYLAHIHGQASVCVAKVLDPERARQVDETPRARFRREAELQMLTHHPGIPRCLYYDESHPDYVYMLMEYVDGIDLGRLLKQRKRPLELPHVLALGLEYLDALDHLHRLSTPDGVPQGLVHRDISPSNLMLRFDGQPTLIDLGIAKVSDSRITTGVMFIGKPHYAAPEQLLGDATPQSDLFSLGLVLLELLTGRVDAPRDLVSPFDIYRYRKDHGVERLSARRPDLPAALDALLASATDVVPQRRPRDAQSFRQALLRAAGGARPSRPDDLAAFATSHAERRHRAARDYREMAELHESDATDDTPSYPRTRTIIPPGRRDASQGMAILGLVVVAVGAAFAFGSTRSYGPPGPLRLPQAAEAASTSAAPPQALARMLPAAVPREQVPGDQSPPSPRSSSGASPVPPAVEALRARAEAACRDLDMSHRTPTLRIVKALLKAVGGSDVVSGRCIRKLSRRGGGEDEIQRLCGDCVRTIARAATAPKKRARRRSTKRSPAERRTPSERAPRPSTFQRLGAQAKDACRELDMKRPLPAIDALEALAAASPQPNGKASRCILEISLMGGSEYDIRHWCKVCADDILTEGEGQR